MISQSQIRWMIRRDMKQVLDIENKSFDYPWSEDDFLECLRQRNCIGMVADCDGKIIGYMIYELHKKHLHIVNFAVAYDYRRQGVGTAMIDKLIGKLTSQRRTELILEIVELNLEAQFFFKEMGFRAVEVLKEYFNDNDAYVMKYKIDKECTLTIDRM